MGDHDLIGDNAPDTAPPKIIEAKVVAASAVTLLGGMVFALLNAIQADSTILGGLPPWLQFVLLAIIPPAATFAGGYAKPSNRV